MTDRQIKIILEVFESKFQTIHEYVKGIPQMKMRLTTLEEDVHDIKQNIRAIKSVIKQDHAALQNHEKRITTLEQA